MAVLLGTAAHEGVAEHLESCGTCSEAEQLARAALGPLLRSRATGGRMTLDRGALWGRILLGIDAAAESELLTLQQQINEALGNAYASPDVSRRVSSAALGAPWMPTGVQGVRIKVLAEDRALDRRTTLLEMDAGCAFPAHAHHGEEECFVLRGDLATTECVLSEGDHQRLSAGTTHAEQVTEAGCLVVIVGSCRDGAS